MAMSSAQLRQLVGRTWVVAVFKMWVSRFIHRHRHELSQRACRALADKRAGAVVYDGVIVFCQELTTFQKFHQIPSHAVFNFDKTRMVQGQHEAQPRRGGEQGAGQCEVNQALYRGHTAAVCWRRRPDPSQCLHP